MIFEREQKAITTFVNTFGGSFKKLDPQDVDYKIFDKQGNLIAYAEVNSIIKTMRNAYPLSAPAKKIVKLIDKRLPPVVIWYCEDGIIYGRPEVLVGEVKQGGRPPREGTVSDIELMFYYDKQKALKYVRFL